ncbi:autotransporter outer membrane beta-barrel domain-containing protein [Bartonella sp. TT121SHDZB]|uniref:autotransporter outer membrane beta-barrel domain-containing protein n=1 Tax=Bartonella sp. TT121SHDZB TaxID=3243580 RepID=UPI0035CF5932
MINVFKKRTRLYALTTSAFFFLQGVDTSMEVMGNRLLLPNFGTSLSYANTSTTLSSPTGRANSSRGLQLGDQTYSPITSCHTTKKNGAINLGALMNGIGGDPSVLGGVPGVPGGVPGVPGGVPGVPGGVPGVPGGVPRAIPGAVPAGSMAAAIPGGIPDAVLSVNLGFDGAAVPGGLGPQPRRQIRDANRSARGSAQDNADLSSAGLNGDMIYGAISCDNVGNYGIKGGIIIAKKDESAVSVKGQNAESAEKNVLHLDTVSIMSVKGENGSFSEGAAGVVKLIDSSSKEKDNEDNNALFLSEVAVLVENGHVDLIKSDIKGFFIGLEAKGSGNINMEGGSIKGTHIAALAEDGGTISLDEVKVNVLEIGFLSSKESIILVNSGEMTIPAGGIGVMSRDGGLVTLDGTIVRVSERDSNGLIESAGLLSYGGSVSFKNGKLEGSDTIALWVTDEFGMDVFDRQFLNFEDQEDQEDQEEEEEENSVEDSGNVRLRERIITTPHANGSAIREVSSIIKNSLGENSPFAGDTAFSKKATHLMISDIQNSTIKLGGKSYGIYLDGEDDITRENKAVWKEMRKDIWHAVLLKGTRLKVPEGVAIYGHNSEGSIVLKDDSTLSGGLLLKAENDSNLSVFVHDSLIMGAARIDKDSYARLFLSNGSEWYVTKDLYSSLPSSDNISDKSCVDSCISSMKLANSNIRFFTSLRNENAGDIEYRTLRIGSGKYESEKGVVYTASGISKIYFNVNLASADTKNAQVSDRLIVNGNVDGKTIVHVNDISGGKGQADSGGHNSVSLIQVYGQAEQDSFKLEGSYVTLGTPYKYILRAEKKKNDPFISELVGLGNEFWNFSLESENVVSSVGEGAEDSSLSEQVAVQSPSTPVSETKDTLLVTTDGDDETISISLLNNSSEHDEGYLVSSASVVSGKTAGGPVGRVLMLGHSGNGGVSSQCSNMEQNGAGRSQVAYSCSDGKSYTIQGQTLKATDKTQHSMHAKNQNTVIKLEGATISGADSADLKNGIDLTQSALVSAVLAEEKAEIVLDKNSTIQSSVIGLEAKSGGKVKMNAGMVNAHYVGALANSGSSVNLKDTKINMTGDFAAAGLASKAGEIIMDSGAITLEKGVAVRSESGGSVKLDKVNITAKKMQGESDSAKVLGRAAFLLSDNGSVEFKNGNVVTDAHALWIVKSDDNVVETGSSRRRRSSEVRPNMNRADIESSIVRVEGEGTYGIYFDGLTLKEGSKQNRSKDLAKITAEKSVERSRKGNTAEQTGVVKRSAVSTQEKTLIGITGAISLKKTDFEVANGIAIYGNNSGGHVSLENKTTLTGDLLLKAENSSNISVSVDGSIVTGDVRIDKSSYAKLDLINKSKWILTRGAQKNLGTPDSGCVDSCVSFVSLVNSAIYFEPSESKAKYQTLHIGNGKGTVYEAQGDALIYLNARLNPDDSSDQQVTDRLVIHGDVSGKTKIHVRGDAGNVGNGQANAKIAHSVSIIQVYGQAKKDSFQLEGDYVALINSPYKYTLRAYAPEATSKQGHVQQKFVKEGGKFWNFRLENQYVKSVGFAALPGQFVRSVVPQVPTYLILPNSVFHTGLMDISNQNKQLETLRTTSNGIVDVRENPALYLRGYGGSYRYTSDLSALEYGYGGDFSYNGVEAGVLLQTIENADSTISFGVMGTYGKLSLQPLNVEQSQKSAFDKWTATVYGSMQHNVGFYVDGLLSYGLFKGDVLTLARGKTATLKGDPLSVSLSGGQTIATGYKGFVFDPQVQVVYQHLQFNKARDIDNFDIEMGKLDQWVARVGGRLTKTPTGSEEVNTVAFYGKLYLAHGFGGKQSMHFNDAFKLGAFGSSLEAGLGVNAKLFPQFSLHADILYQHKLNKAGFSGTSFSGGVRYQF